MFRFEPKQTLQKGIDTNIYFSAYVKDVEVGYILIQNYNFKVGNVELAYQIYKPFRGHHLATNMVKEFMEFALKIFYIKYFDAYVRESNFESQKVLLNNNFSQKKPQKKLLENTDERIYFSYDIVQSKKENPSPEDIEKVLKEIE